MSAALENKDRNETRVSRGRVRHASHRAGRRRGIRWRSNAKLWGWPLCEVALGPNQANGERIGHARAVLAVGNVADGVVAIGGISRGTLSIGGIAMGLGSVGGISLGLVAALGGVAVAPLALGGVAVGILATGGAGWNLHGRLHHAALSWADFLPTRVTGRPPAA